MATYIAYSKNGCAFGVWIASNMLSEYAEAYLRANSVNIDYIHKAKDFVGEKLDDHIVRLWFLKDFLIGLGAIE